MDYLDQLQKDLSARMLSCPDFDHVDVSEQDATGAKKISSLRDRINRVLGGLKKTKGRAGLAVLVMKPVVRVEKNEQGLPGPQMNVHCVLQFLECHEINRGAKGTGISAENLGFTALALTHLWQSRPSTLFMAAETAMEPAEVDEEMAADIAYQVNLTTPLPTTPLNKCETPTVIVHEGMATIFAKAGERAFYTLSEDALPWQGEPTAVAYGEPFAVTSGQIIRAASYSDTAVGSDVFEITA